MIDTLKKIFGIGPKVNYAELITRGAIILDVRTSSEYKTGHIEDSVNIPLQILLSNLAKLEKNKPIITCCASGIRSISAKNILKSKGFREVYNGGGWMSLQNKIK